MESSLKGVETSSLKAPGGGQLLGEAQKALGLRRAGEGAANFPGKVGRTPDKV